MATVNEKMTALAGQIRILSGTSEAIGLDAMTTNVGDANTEVNTQAELLMQVVTALEGKASSGGFTLQSKTATPSINTQTIVPDSGYDGLSDVVINGDNNLVAENIKSDVSIFGVVGTYSGEVGGSSAAGEWVSVASLPQTLLEAPGVRHYYYYETPESCIAVVAMFASGSAMYMTYLVDGTFQRISCGIFGTISDADGSGTIIQIALDTDASGVFLLPIFNITE